MLWYGRTCAYAREANENQKISTEHSAHSGQATGPHLHFELIHEGVYLNPEFYLAV